MWAALGSNGLRAARRDCHWLVLQCTCFVLLGTICSNVRQQTKQCRKQNLGLGEILDLRGCIILLVRVRGRRAFGANTRLVVAEQS